MYYHIPVRYALVIGLVGRTATPRRLGDVVTIDRRPSTRREVKLLLQYVLYRKR